MDPEKALFCILPQSSQGNAALHIQSVLLQAFCYENDIHIIQVHISVLGVTRKKNAIHHFVRIVQQQIRMLFNRNWASGCQHQ
jgi:hypothetical protein